mgnify:CR=1 FL=1
MSLARMELRATYAFVERNANLIKRYWGWEVAWIAYSVANSVAVVLIAKSANAAVGREAFDEAAVDRLVLFLAVGAVVWHYISVLFGTVSQMVAWERWEGTIEYTFMAPVRRLTQMVGTAIFSVLYGLVHTACIVAVIALVFGLELHGADLLAAGVVMLAGSLSLIGLGTMGAVLPLLYPERGEQMAWVVQAALVLVSGVYALPEQMPEPLRTLSAFSPATYLIQGMRDALLDGAGLGTLWPTVVGLFLAGLLLIPAGVWVFRQGERYAKRTGRLKRSG